MNTNKTPNTSYFHLYIRAFFDDFGNMFLYLVVKSERNTEGKIRNYYLVYIDDEYNEHGSELAIDSPKLSTEPFYKKLVLLV